MILFPFLAERLGWDRDRLALLKSREWHALRPGSPRVLAVRVRVDVVVGTGRNVAVQDIYKRW